MLLSDTPLLERGEDRITVTMPDSARRGVSDVVTLRALTRAISDLFTSHKHESEAEDAFDRALIKMINVNGALARRFIER